MISRTPNTPSHTAHHPLLLCFPSHYHLSLSKYLFGSSLTSQRCLLDALHRPARRVEVFLVRSVHPRSILGPEKFNASEVTDQYSALCPNQEGSLYLLLLVRLCKPELSCARFQKPESEVKVQSHQVYFLSLAGPGASRATRFAGVPFHFFAA